MVAGSALVDWEEVAGAAEAVVADGVVGAEDSQVAVPRADGKNHIQNYCAGDFAFIRCSKASFIGI